jgi:hypothetical protein
MTLGRPARIASHKLLLEIHVTHFCKKVLVLYINAARSLG